MTVVRGPEFVVDADVRVHQLIPITDEDFGEGSSIRSAVVSDPWILLVLDNGRAVLYSVDPKSKDIDVHSGLSKIDVRLSRNF